MMNELSKEEMITELKRWVAMAEDIRREHLRLSQEAERLKEALRIATDILETYRLDF